MQTAAKAKAFGYEPSGIVSFSNFGYPHREHMQRIQEATKILDLKKVDFEYDGEMGVDVALNVLRKIIPFADYLALRISDNAGASCGK